MSSPRRRRAARPSEGAPRRGARAVACGRALMGPSARLEEAEVGVVVERVVSDVVLRVHVGGLLLPGGGEDARRGVGEADGRGACGWGRRAGCVRTWRTRPQGRPSIRVACAGRLRGEGAPGVSRAAAARPGVRVTRARGRTELLHVEHLHQLAGLHVVEADAVVVRCSRSRRKERRSDHARWRFVAAAEASEAAVQREA